MASSAELKLVISAIDNASAELKKITKSMESVGVAAKKTAPSFASMTGAVAAGQAAYNLASKAIKSFGNFLVSTVKEAEEAMFVQAQLNAVLTSTAGVAGVTGEAAVKLAKDLQQVSIYGDDAILSAENMVLTFTNIGSNIFPETMQAILDMSTALKQDLSSSAKMVSKALQDPILGVTALRKVGVNFNESQQAFIANLVKTGHSLEAQKLILKELNTEYGGSALAASQTYGGQVLQLKNNFSDLKEEIGKQLLPTLMVLTKDLNGHAVEATNATAKNDDFARAIYKTYQAAKSVGLMLFGIGKTLYYLGVVFTKVIQIILAWNLDVVKAFLNTGKIVKTVAEAIALAFSGKFSEAKDLLTNLVSESLQTTKTYVGELASVLSDAGASIGETFKQAGSAALEMEKMSGYKPVLAGDYPTFTPDSGLKDSVEETAEASKKAKAELEKLQDSLDDLTGTYVDSKNKISSELSSLSASHQNKLSDIKNSIREVQESMNELRNAYKSDVTGVEQDAAGKIAEIYVKLNEKKIELDKIRNSETTAESIQRYQELQAQIKKEEDFLSSNNEYLLGLQDEITAAKEFSNKSEAEQAIILAQQKTQQLTDEFNDKMAKLQAEKSAYLAKQTEEVAAYTLRKEELKKVDEEITKLYEEELNRRGVVTDDYIKNEKQKWDDLKRSIENAIAAQARAQSASLSVGGTAKLSVAGKRASGGPVSSGNTYVVGEKGAELFTPSTYGYITPNSQLSSGGSIVVNINGGTYLSREVAEDIGDKIINKLKLVGQKI